MEIARALIHSSLTIETREVAYVMEITSHFIVWHILLNGNIFQFLMRWPNIVSKTMQSLEKVHKMLKQI